MARVSVIIPCYNMGDTLKEAVDSVLNQTYTDYEIIIVNDGSDDHSTNLKLSQFAKTGIRLIHTRNQGVSAARNLGIAEAKGVYILPLDADDKIAPTYLEKGVEVLDRRPRVGIVYCEATVFGEVSGIWELQDFSLPHLLLDNLIFSSALFRRRDWQLVGGYREPMRHGWEDWDFWLSMMEQGMEVFRIPEQLFFYRIRGVSRDRSIGYGRKLILMLRIIAAHRTLYLRHSKNIVRILIGGTRRRTPTFKVFQ